jgi:hypothetical protein
VSSALLAARVEPQHLADHPLLFAVPVLIPTFVVVLLVALVVVRDRRRVRDGEPPEQE